MTIDVQNATKNFGGKAALSGVCLELKAPAFIGLLGQNGAGKSTLMKLLTLGLLPSSGEITLDGTPLVKSEKRLKSSLGYLPQEYGLFDELTVYQFLDYMSAMKNFRNADESRIEQVIEDCGLSECRKARIGSLSGGYKQRVGIAQAFLGDPEMIILDEPTVGLDPEERLNFRAYFSKAAHNKIVLLSTHIVEDIRHSCNRLIVLHEGRVIYDGTADGLIELAKDGVGDAPTLEDAFIFATKRGTAI